MMDRYNIIYKCIQRIQNSTKKKKDTHSFDTKYLLFNLNLRGNINSLEIMPRASFHFVSNKTESIKYDTKIHVILMCVGFECRLNAVPFKL